MDQAPISSAAARLGRTAARVHAAGLFFGIGAAALTLTSLAQSTDGSIFALVSASAGTVAILWSFFLSARALHAGESLRWPLTVIIASVSECALVTAYLWFVHLNGTANADPDLQSVERALLRMGVPVGGTVATIAFVAAIAPAWLIARWKAKRAIAAGASLDRARRWSWRLNAFAWCVFIASVATLPWVLFVFCAKVADKDPSDWRVSVARLTPDFVRDPVTRMLPDSLQLPILRQGFVSPNTLLENIDGSFSPRNEAALEGLTQSASRAEIPDDILNGFVSAHAQPDYALNVIVALCKPQQLMRLWPQFIETPRTRGYSIGLIAQVQHGETQFKLWTYALTNAEKNIRYEAIRCEHTFNASVRASELNLKRRYVQELRKMMDNPDIVMRRAAAWSLFLIHSTYPRGTPSPEASTVANTSALDGAPPVAELPAEAESAERIRLAANEWLEKNGE